MSKRFINRAMELDFLNEEYNRDSASFVVIYGRRRIGKTTLIRNFIRNKPALYFLASEEMEKQNILNLKNLMADFTGSPILKKDFDFSWDDLFEVLKDSRQEEKRIIVIDEFQYLGKINKSFPSIFQRIWDNLLEAENIMVILCGSLITMMESQTLNYSSPLYGRRTGQIKMKQIGFNHYHEFMEKLEPLDEELIEYYAVTGGVPKYIDIFNAKKSKNIFDAIQKHVLNPRSFLYEEPIFLLEKEVGEISTYFSLIKAIASGNRKLSKIATLLGVPQTNLTRYMQTLIDLDLIRRVVPVTEPNPAKSKQGLYYITDNYIEFWFKFIYPFRSFIEMEDFKYVMDKIKQNFIDNHVSFVYEQLCLEKMWSLNKEGKLPFKLTQVGRWWNKNTEIDIMGLNQNTREIILGECKYINTKVDVDLLYKLIEKAKEVKWNNQDRKEYYILFCKSGFTDRLQQMAGQRKDTLLITLL
jgi:uncharacterized protein